jgi:hypothetical protein
VLAVIGLIINVAFDLDNVYDMTTTALWFLTLAFAFAGAFLGGKAVAETRTPTTA